MVTLRKAKGEVSITFHSEKEKRNVRSLLRALRVEEWYVMEYFRKSNTKHGKSGNYGKLVLRERREGR